jgi:hypothetical protein
VKTVHKDAKPAPASAPAILQDRAEPLSELSGSGAMVRTQIYLSRAEHEFLQREGHRRGEPMAAVIRSLVDEKMALPEDIWENNPLLAPPADREFIGPEDGAINHDHYLHGAPKKWMKKRGQWVATPALPADYYTNPKSAAAYDRMVEGSK